MTEIPEDVMAKAKDLYGQLRSPWKFGFDRIMQAWDEEQIARAILAAKEQARREALEELLEKWPAQIDVPVPSDIVEYGERHDLKHWAMATYSAGFVDASRFVRSLITAEREEE